MSNQNDGQGGMPEWLLKLTEAKLGGFRNARWRRCQKCQEIVIHGMDADLCAGMVDVDPAPITPQQEMWCAVQGRRTYVLDIDEQRKVKINDRIRYDLAAPERRHRPVVAAHICGQRYSGFIDELKKPKATATANTKPPF